MENWDDILFYVNDFIWYYLFMTKSRGNLYAVDVDTSDAHIVAWNFDEMSLNRAILHLLESKQKRKLLFHVRNFLQYIKQSMRIRLLTIVMCTGRHIHGGKIKYSLCRVNIVDIFDDDIHTRKAVRDDPSSNKRN